VVDEDSLADPPDIVREDFGRPATAVVGSDRDINRLDTVAADAVSDHQVAAGSDPVSSMVPIAVVAAADRS